MAEIFARKKLGYDMIIRARFGTTVCALVKAGLGIAPSRMAASPVSTADRRIHQIYTCIAVKRGTALSLCIEHFIHCLRLEMQAGGLGPKSAIEGCVAGPEKIT